jgi:hypothetical protein
MLRALWGSLACVLLATACSGGKPTGTLTDGGYVYSGAGPVDGAWTHASTTCDGTAQGGAFGLVVTVNNTTGTMSITDNGCQRVEDVTFSYPTESSFTLEHSTSVTCTPSACDSECSPAQAQEDETFNYTVSGNTLKISKVVNVSDGDCPMGQTVEHTLNK